MNLNKAGRRIRSAGLFVVFISQLLYASETSLKKAADLLSKGSLAEAVKILREVIADDGSNVEARLLLGTALAVQGERSESIAQMTEAARLRPNAPEVHDKLGIVLSRFLETKAAGEEFEKAIALDPTFANAHINLALIQAQAGELDLAAEHLDRAIRLLGNAPSAAYPHFLRAKIWGTKNEIGEAIVELEKAVQLRPDDAAAWSDLGGMRRLAADRDGAKEALKKAVELNPDDSVAQYRLGQLYLEQGQPRSALAHLRKAVVGNDTDIATLYNLERALRKLGNIDEADRIAKQVTEIRKQSTHGAAVGLEASRLNDEGIQLEKSGDVHAALAKYRSALDLDPTGVGFRLNYGLALCRLDHWKLGAAELREVLRADPNNADAAKALYIAEEQERARLQPSSHP